MAKQTDPRLTEAMRALASGQVQQAESLCRAVLSDRRRDDLAMALLAQVCNQIGKYDEALQLIRNAIAKNGKRADYHGLLADILSTKGEFRNAIGAYDKALKYQPNHPGVLAGKSNTWLRLNEPEKALKQLAPSMKQGNEDLTVATVYAKALIAVDKPDEAATVLLAHLPAEREPIETRRSLYFVLGKAMEKCNEYKSAFEAYEQSNSLARTNFDIHDCEEKHNAIKSAINKEVASKRSNNQDDSRIFIVGMLRSGSTLTEQIIDAHPDGVGLGELEIFPNLLQKYSQGQTFSEFWKNIENTTLDAIAQEYIEATPSNAIATVDKQLGNYQFVGAIASILPNAKFIHCKRDPLSIGLSCFAQKFPPSTNAWANNLRNIGLYYRQYDAMMKHWQSLFSDRILEIQYEELVQHQEKQTTQILEFCNLPFHERCMRFWETGRTVLTLSQDQVRQPMYSSAVNRYEHFGELLDPLREALAD
ncbi:MAG: tetratricopeptide repeat protein [Phycisphaerae bacterium]|jgi:tetratricopeptide (TPR) repeat protein|nr:tetratricopeptide repeat protein [Phycisphaerae bacterium]